MSNQSTFDPALVDDKDWVRQLTGDTDMDNAALTDAQCLGFIAEIQSIHGDGLWVKYLAAALAGEAVMGVWMAKGGGIIEKQVGTLRLRRIGDDGGETAYRHHIDKLRERGNYLLLKGSGTRPASFRVL